MLGSWVWGEIWNCCEGPGLPWLGIRIWGTEGLFNGLRSVTFIHLRCVSDDHKVVFNIPTVFCKFCFSFGVTFFFYIKSSVVSFIFTYYCSYYENWYFQLYTGLFKMIVGVLTTCHTQYTSDSSICIFLFNRTTLQVFVTYLTGALYVHHLWFYRHQHENRVRSKLFVACQLFAVCRHLSKPRSKQRNV